MNIPWWGDVKILPELIKPSHVPLRGMSDEMNYTEHLNKYWHELSLGLNRKAGLIGCFLPEAKLRILDEPFAGGIDPLGMERLNSWMTDARDRGETIIFSTQVLDQAEDAADRIALMKEGQIHSMGSPGDLIEQAGIASNEPRTLSKAFLRLMDNQS